MIVIWGFDDTIRGERSSSEWPSPTRRDLEASTVTLKFGYERPDWDAPNVEIVEILGGRVRHGRGPMTYGERASKVKAISLEPHQYAMFAILGGVSDDEDSAGRAMLSAYVATAETGVPGGGFFELSEKLGRRVDDRLAFWVEEIRRGRRGVAGTGERASAAANRAADLR